MSMTGSPRRLNEPIDARDSVVIRDCISFFTASLTSTSEPENWRSSTLPTSTPATRITAPALRPCTSGKWVFR